MIQMSQTCVIVWAGHILYYVKLSSTCYTIFALYVQPTCITFALEGETACLTELDPEECAVNFVSYNMYFVDYKSASLSGHSQGCKISLDHVQHHQHG